MQRSLLSLNSNRILISVGEIYWSAGGGETREGEKTETGRKEERAEEEEMVEGSGCCSNGIDCVVVTVVDAVAAVAGGVAVVLPELLLLLLLATLAFFRSFNRFFFAAKPLSSSLGSTVTVCALRSVNSGLSCLNFDKACTTVFTA